MKNFTKFGKYSASWLPETFLTFEGRVSWVDVFNKKELIMKMRFITPVSGLLALSSLLYAREFTDTQGRKLDADILSVAGDQVTLKRKSDMRTFTVASTTFSEDDQKFIEEWAATSMKYSFDVSYVKKKISDVKAQKGVVKTETETWVYEVRVKNLLAVPVGELRVDHWCFRRDDEGKGKVPAKIVSSGSNKIESIEGLATVNVDSSEIILEKSQLQGNFYYLNGNKDKQEDGMGGIAIRIFDKNGKEIHSWATKDDLLAATKGKSVGQVSGINSSPFTPR